MIGNKELSAACHALGITTNETIHPEETITDVVLLVRARNINKMNDSSLMFLTSDGTDYVTQVGMCRWAEMIVAQDCDEE